MDFARINARNIVTAALVLLLATSVYYVYQAFAVILRSEALYLEAQEAFESGDAVAAESALIEVVRINPSHEDAKDLLLQIKQGIDVADELPPGVAAGGTLAKEGKRDDRNGLSDDGRARKVPDQLPGYKLIAQESGSSQNKSVFEALDKDSPVALIELSIEAHKDAAAADALYQRRFAYPKVQQKIMFNNRLLIMVPTARKRRFWHGLRLKSW